MATVKQATTFWQFLQNNKIEIPIIQRDYAQGRKGKEKLREKFLKDLKDALEDTHKTLKLDFVYGSEENGSINPLDGQQRLTTLWLLHWYIAYKAGKLQENKEVFKKFTYETRVSSREFCERLSKFSEPQPDGVGIVEHITNQTWFYSAWKEDPTIQAMLNMLGGTDIKDKNGDIVDGLEEIFKDTDKSTFEGYWTKLTNEENPSINEILKNFEPTKNYPVDVCPIIFYYLPLDNFGLSDDLYIKMNARGLPLTDFENFKANIVDFLRKKVSDGDFTLTENDANKKKDENNKWIAGFESKFDNAWTNIFWDKKSYEYKIDQIFFHFIYRYLLCSLITTVKDDKRDSLLSNDAITKEPKKPDENAIEEEKKKYIRISEVYKTYNLLRKDPLTYEAIKQGKREYEDEWLSKSTVFRQETFKNLATILDNYSNSKSKITESDYSASWGDTIQFIPEYIKDTNSIQKLSEQEYITAKQRVVFHAVCKYFERDSDNFTFDTTTFKQWMRVVWNIVENCNATGNMIGVIRLIDQFAGYSHEIYEFLANKMTDANIKIESQATEQKQQVEEERKKANKILEDCSWESKIIDAEKQPFFKGRIRDLFDWNWNDENDFKVERFEKWDEMCMSGKNPSDEVRRALLTRGMKNYPLKNRSFGYNNWNDIIAQNRADFIIFIDDILNCKDCNSMICTYLSDNSKNRMTDKFYHIIKYPYFLEYMEEKTAYKDKDNGRWIFQQKQNERVWHITEPYVETMNLFEDLKSKKENGKTNWEICFWNGERDGNTGVGVVDSQPWNNTYWKSIAVDYFYNGTDYTMQVYVRGYEIAEAENLWMTKFQSPITSAVGYKDCVDNSHKITGDYKTIKSYILTLIS